MIFRGFLTAKFNKMTITNSIRGALISFKRLDQGFVLDVGGEKQVIETLDELKSKISEILDSVTTGTLSPDDISLVIRMEIVKYSINA